MVREALSASKIETPWGRYLAMVNGQSWKHPALEHCLKPAQTEIGITMGIFVQHIFIVPTYLSQRPRSSGYSRGNVCHLEFAYHKPLIRAKINVRRLYKLQYPAFVGQIYAKFARKDSYLLSQACDNAWLLPANHCLLGNLLIGHTVELIDPLPLGSRSLFGFSLLQGQVSLQDLLIFLAHRETAFL